MDTDTTFTHELWLSPFTWRYGSEEMRALWSESGKRRTWRRIWVALASVQSDHGLVTDEQVADLQAHVDDIDIAQAHALEQELHHDLMAEVHTYAAQCSVGGGIIHLGATSMDIEDNADALRIRDGIHLVVQKVESLMAVFADRIDELADVATMAFTHLQPAEPTTMGYRLAQYGQDLASDLEDLRAVHAGMRGKGFKGAVGTAASYTQLLNDDAAFRQFEDNIMQAIGIPAFPAATQTAPRKQEYRVLCSLASLGQSLYKFAADVRLLQSPPLGEWAEPFGSRQIGSSAMPFKRNPINAENMDSLARLLATLPRVAWDNAAHSYLERTLDDSANRRAVLPQAFLIADELLRRAHRVLRGLRIDRNAAARLLDEYGPFAATERALMELVRRGGDRQELHEVIREHSLSAWAARRQGHANPLVHDLSHDPRVTRLANATEVSSWLQAADYVGIAPQRARQIAASLRNLLTTNNSLPQETS